MCGIRLLSILLLLVAVPGALPGEGMDFLTLFPGGRSSAMAGAGAAMSGYAEAAFYNPAGLSFVRSPDMLIEYYKVSSYGPPVWSTAVAVQLTPALGAALFAAGTEHYPDGLGVDDIVSRDYDVGLSASSLAFGWLAAGVSLKYVGICERHYLSYLDSGWTRTGYALAADAGILARRRVGLGRLGMGLAVRNLGTRMDFVGHVSGGVQLPVLATAGAEWLVTARDLGRTRFLTSLPEWLFPDDWQVDRVGWTITCDYRSVRQEHYSLRDDYTLQSLGFELRPIPFVAARIGRVYTVQRFGWPEAGFTWGLGLDLRYLRVDLAEDHQLAMLGYYGPSHYRLSASLNIGEPLTGRGGLLGRK